MTEPHVHAEDCGCAVPGLAYRPMDAGPIVVMRQPLEPFMTTALDALPVRMLPSLRVAGSLRQIETGLAQGLARVGLEPLWLADWLVGNALFQARLFKELTAAARLRMRLEAVDDDGCCRFHTDNISHRLVCTYRGPGTEWIDPRAASLAEPGAPIDPESIRQMERGASAFMRGGKGATLERPGLIHRSPRIEGTGIVRLVLVVEADDAD